MECADGLRRPLVSWETSKVMVVSTSHMTDEDQKLLTGWVAVQDWSKADTYQEGGPRLFLMPHPYGWMFWACEELDGEGAVHAGLSEHVATIMLIACREGNDYVLFDRDGPVVDGWETFEW